MTNVCLPTTFFIFSTKILYFCILNQPKRMGIMEKTTIIGEINGFLIEEFEIEEHMIKPEASWKEIGIDSLDFVDIVVIFVIILRYLGLKPAYFLLRIVSTYYLFFSRKSNRFIYRYFKEIHHYSSFKARRAVYRNYNLFGEILIDKVAIYSGLVDKFTFDLEDEKHLAAMDQGGFMISAHIGNWEMAGKKSDRIHKTMNLVMLDAEHKRIRHYLDSVMKGRNFRVIPLKDDLSHLISIRQALDNGELVAIHGDRFMEGMKTIPATFMGRKARFPEGPFYLALRMNAPVSFAFAMKEGPSHYHFYATPPKKYDIPEGKRIGPEQIMPVLQDYIQALETMVIKYPEQWFNYYEFWQ
jgi:predicted LPLAT superfamily acyltransferase